MKKNSYDIEVKLIDWLKLCNFKDKDIAEILIKLGSDEKKIKAINLLAINFNNDVEIKNIIIEIMNL